MRTGFQHSQMLSTCSFSKHDTLHLVSLTLQDAGQVNLQALITLSVPRKGIAHLGQSGIHLLSCRSVEDHFILEIVVLLPIFNNFLKNVYRGTWRRGSIRGLESEETENYLYAEGEKFYT